MNKCKAKHKPSKGGGREASESAIKFHIGTNKECKRTKRILDCRSPLSQERLLLRTDSESESSSSSKCSQEKLPSDACDSLTPEPPSASLSRLSLQQTMFLVRSFACLHSSRPCMRRLPSPASRRRESESATARRRQPEPTYQGSFESFSEMVRLEKESAKCCILLEDRCNSLDKQTPENLSRVLDSRVTRIEGKYRLGRRGFTLVSLEEPQVWRRVACHADIAFPVRTRLLSLTRLATTDSEAGAEATRVPVRDLTRTDAVALLKASDIEDASSKLVSSSRMTRFGCKMRIFFLNQIEELVCSGVLEHFHLLPFGSSVNGFGSDSSDLDMALVSPPVVAPHPSRRPSLVYQGRPVMSERFQSKLLVDFVGDHLQYFMPGITSVQRIPNARVPIIKIHSDVTNLDCDISFQTASASVQMAEALFEYSRVDDRIAKLVSFIKIWAKSHSLTSVNPGPWYTNFMLMLMIIHFFQTRQGFQLPSMWDLKACRRIASTDEDESFETILREFFEFISSFDYRSHGMSVLSGRTILKPTHSAIHIENPCEPDKNVSINVEQSEVQRLVTAANTSLAIIVDSRAYTLADLCKPTTKPTVSSFNAKSLKGIKVHEYLTE